MPTAARAWPTAALLAALASLVACGATRAFDEYPGGMPFWTPLFGLALALVLRWPDLARPQLAGVAAGAALTHWATGTPWWLACGLAAGPVVAAATSARILRWLAFNPLLNQRRDLLLLAAVGLLVGALISSANASVWQFFRQAQAPLPLSHAWWWAWVADALGVMLVVPAVLRCQRAPLLAALQPGRRLGLAGLLATLGASTWAALVLAPSPFLQAQALLLPALVMIGLSLRHGTGLAALVLLAWAVVVSVAVGGPIHHGFFDVPPVLGVELGVLSLLVSLPQAVNGDLVESSQRWQLALDSSDIGVAEWNLHTGQSYASGRWHALLGDPTGQFSDRLPEVLARLHPDDRSAVDALLAPTLRPATGHLRQEVRLRVQDLWCWFDLNLKICERDTVGAPVRLLATLMDIEAQRGAQERQHLSSNLFMHLHEGLLITDAEMRVLDANPTYSRITGVPREELLGTVPSLLSPGLDADPSSQVQNAAMWADLHTGGHWIGEVIERRRNGDPCALHVTVSCVNGPEGDLRYHVLVVSDITEQRLQSERIERQAHFDELTRLPNRAHLSQLLIEAMRMAESDGHLLAVCYLDLDHFKAINERLGHQAGDRLLAELAIRLRGALRSRGTARADIAARLGGDEFALLLHAGSVEEARFAVERVLRLVAQPFMVAPHGEASVVTASVGVTVYPLDGSDADTLLRHADHAMYGAKQAGRNGHLFFDTEHRRRTEERVLAIGRVQEALDQNELTLYYQPKVDLRHGTVLGVEALLRWNHPERGLVSPVHFLPLIEHTGLSARIGDHVLASALHQLEAWQAEGLDLSVSVNVSARHLQEPDFVQRLTELLARHARPLGPSLELEVLETAALADVAFTSSLLAQCARLGVRWALDDFGTGYSTLTYLKRLPVQVLKIDRSFVHNMLTDEQDKAIVEGLIGLARSFDCLAVAEGVETAAQARMLLDMGCQVGQGEGIAKPMPAAEVAAWVRNWRGLFALVPAPVMLNGAPPKGAQA